MTDGTASGTRMVKQLSGSGIFQGQERRAMLGELLLFCGYSPEAGWELWRSDGTGEGTFQLTDLRPGPAGSFPGGMHATETRLFFTADDGQHGEELWVTDGTIAGTRLLADLNPGEASSAPQQHRLSDGRLYFSADDGRRGRELWASDRTASGAELIADLVPGTLSGDPIRITAFGRGVLFIAVDPTGRPCLWRYEPPEEENTGEP